MAGLLCLKSSVQSRLTPHTLDGCSAAITSRKTMENHWVGRSISAVSLSVSTSTCQYRMMWEVTYTWLEMAFSEEALYDFLVLLVTLGTCISQSKNTCLFNEWNKDEDTFIKPGFKTTETTHSCTTVVPILVTANQFSILRSSTCQSRSYLRYIM